MCDGAICPAGQILMCDGAICPAGQISICPAGQIFVSRGTQECPVGQKPGRSFSKRFFLTKTDLSHLSHLSRRQTVLADERKGTSRLWTTKVANPDASAYAPTSMNVLCVARRRDVKTHLHDRMHTDFGRNRHPRSYHVHRMDHATTMERAFEADFAYAHQFMH